MIQGIHQDLPGRHSKPSTSGINISNGLYDKNLTILAFFLIARFFEVLLLENIR